MRGLCGAECKGREGGARALGRKGHGREGPGCVCAGRTQRSPSYYCPEPKCWLWTLHRRWLAFASAATQRVQQPQIVFCNSHDVHPGGKSTNKARAAPTPRGTRNKTQTPTHERTGARTLARIHTCYTWTIARPPSTSRSKPRASRPVRSRAHQHGERGHPGRATHALSWPYLFKCRLNVGD